jgi:hypothetical protein
MDPYLEPHWLDVHSSLVTSARDALNGRLPDDLIASVEERVAIESEAGREHLVGPDVRIFEPRARVRTWVEEPSGGLLTAPFRLVAKIEPITERSIRITEAGTERLVTVIEFISPTNKRAPGMQAFQEKRGVLLASGVNFVEVDLIREGNWQALLEPQVSIPQTLSLYRVCTRIPGDPGAAYVFPIRLRDRLPEIPIPLRKSDPEIRLDLQAHLDHAYVSGRYARRIDYGQPCVPPLTHEDAAWADELLKAVGKR